MLSKFLYLSVAIILSSPLFASDSSENPFLQRKDSYNEHRKTNFKQYAKEARKNGSIHANVEELPKEIFSYLENTKSGEFDKANQTAVYNLLYQATNGSFSRNFTVKELGGGFVSGKIYKVTNDDTDSTYFIKYLRQRTLLVPPGRILGEQANLEAIQNNPRLDPYCWRGSIRGFEDLRSSGFHGAEEAFLSSLATEDPINLKIIVPLKVYNYTFKGKDKVFMILPGAKGKSLASIIEESLTPNSSPASSPSKTQGESSKSSGKQKHISPLAIEKVNTAFQKIGTALGQLHVNHNQYKGNDNPTEYSKDYFAKLGVFSHGDFHAHNVFIHKNTVALIDAETVANSFTPNGLPNGPIYYDFFYLMLMTERHFPGAMASMDWQPFKELFKAYISCYPREMQEGVNSYLYYHLNNLKKFNFTDIFENFTWKKGYSKDTIKGAKNIAQFLVRETVEQLRKEAEERFAKGSEKANQPRMEKQKARMIPKLAPKTPSTPSTSTTQIGSSSSTTTTVVSTSTENDQDANRPSHFQEISHEARLVNHQPRPMGNRIAALIEQHKQLIAKAQPTASIIVPNAKQPPKFQGY